MFSLPCQKQCWFFLYRARKPQGNKLSSIRSLHFSFAAKKPEYKDNKELYDKAIELARKYLVIL